MKRGVAVLVATLLAGCEPAFDVDFVANAPVDGSTVTLRLDGVDLRKQDNSRESRTRSTVGEYRLQRDALPTPADLLSNSDIGGGEYSGIRLDFAADEGSVARTGMTTELIEIGTVDDAAVAFMIDDGEDDRVSLVVALDLVLSLRENEDEAGFTLDPRLRAMERSDAAGVSGTIAASRFSNPSCALPDARPAVYAFAGLGVTPDERDGDAVEPLAVSELAAAGGSSFGYAVDYLPPGPYTLAFTCESQLENGRLPAADDEVIDFFSVDDLTLAAGEQVELNFLP